jgi:serine kinase of HPr protein (carbohydrate metabolism regulator)
MKIGELAEKLGLEIIQGKFEDTEILGGYTSDLLSDVMAHSSAGEVLITIQAHKNAVAVATLAGITAVVIANNRPVQQDMITAAEEEGIALFRSRENQFVLSGRLYGLLRPRG